MKKLISAVLALAMVFALAACGGTTTTAPAAAPEPETYKLGFGISVSTSATSATAEADGKVQIDPTCAVILVDKDGKIADCYFDVAQSALNITSDGVVLDKDQAYRTKQEKKDDYGMQKASSLAEGEWYQQANFLANYMVGMTLDEVKAIALDDAGYPASDDLRAGTTIGHIPEFITAVSKAYDSLIDAGEAAKITLGIVTDASGSVDLTADADGEAYFYTNYAAAALDANDVITACIFDATQIRFAVAEGGVVGEANNTLTKNELLENYGMQKASSLAEGEWYQQAAHLASRMVGLDKAGVQAIALDEGGHAVDQDILAGTTIGHLDVMFGALVKGM